MYVINKGGKKKIDIIYYKCTQLSAEAKSERQKEGSS